MSALAILTCRQNSHPFQERHIALIEPVKIGRSVARARPSPNNGIFDCKVLSRNHAMLWYENGIFYLQDTKSSNGTFVNDQRLCKGGEESPPREIYSGDLIQFGVNVMENNRHGEKITHGCIIANITLFHPDGREAKPVLFNTPTPGITIQSQELYKLAQFLQEALHREKMLEQKLSTLQELVQNTQESSEGAWQALIDEDRLLSRLEVLENQLHAYSKNHTEDTLRQELVTLQEEKVMYETTAKESLMKVLQEKIEAVTKLADLERSLTKSEDECGHMKDMCEKLQEELQLLAEKYQDQLKAEQDLQIQLHDAETRHMEEVEKAEKEKLDLKDKIEDMVKQEQTLTAKIESLEADKDISSEQLTTMKARLDQYREPNEDDVINNLKSMESDSENEVIQPPEDKDSKDQTPEDVQGKLRETQKQIEEYSLKLEESEKQLKESADKVEELHKELESSQITSLQYLTKIEQLEEKLKLSDLHMTEMVDNTMADLTWQISETSKQSQSSSSLISNLQNQVSDLEKELSTYRAFPAMQHIQRMDETLVASSIDSVDSGSDPDHDAATLRPKKSAEDLEIEKLLQDAKVLLAKTEEDLKTTKNELQESSEHSQKLSEENSALKTDLTTSQTNLAEKADMVIDLQEQLQKAENTTKEVKEQLQKLRDQLVEEQQVRSRSEEEIARLTSSLEEQLEKHRVTLQALDTTRVQLEGETSRLEEAQTTLKEAEKQLADFKKQEKKQAAELHNKLKHRGSPDIADLRTKDSVKRHSPDFGRRHSPDVVELRRRDPLKQRGSPEISDARRKDAHLRDSIEKRPHSAHLRYSFHNGESPSKLPISKRQANEFTALKDECSSLRKRIQAIEAEMKMSRRENLQLSSEYNKLQESYKQLEELKDQLQDKESTWMSNLTDSQKENETTKHELVKAREEIAQLKKKWEDCKAELKRLSGDYGRIAGRSKLISFAASIPLLMLLFAVLLAIYPTLESLTATVT